MATKLDARQTLSRDVLNRIALAAGTSLDALLRSLNSEVTPPFFLQANASLTVNVGSAKVTNPITNYNRTVAAIGADTPNFTSGTIVFPATSGGTVVITPGNDTILTVSSGNYIKATVYLDANNDLNLLFGDQGASEALANALPAPDGTLAIGYIVIRNVGGAIQNVTNSNIYQFVGVGGAGGSGDANELLERLKEYFENSSFEFLSAGIFASVKDTFEDPSTTAVYDVVNKGYAFAAAADEFTSIQMLDAEFLAESRDVSKIDLIAYWKLDELDDAAIYRVSRNGGNEYQTVTMERVGDTDTFRGTLTFQEEAAYQTQQSNHGGSPTTEPFNITTRQAMSQLIVLAEAWVLTNFAIILNKTGSPGGNIWFEICEDNAGVPGDAIAYSALIPMSSLSAGNNSLDVGIVAPLAAGNYHLVARTDASYKSTYSAGVNFVSMVTRQGSIGKPDAQGYNGTNWSAVTNESFEWDVEGRELDLRVQVESSQGNVTLMGFGIFYGASTPVITGLKNIQSFVFDGAADTTTFNITNFTPEPDLLKVYDVNSGKVYRYGAFALSGTQVIFQSGQFYSPGETIKLIFEQMEGGSFDNSDLNGNLLAENRLGSIDPTQDRSAAGEGILLRASNGTLVEVSVAWNGSSYELVIAEVT